MSDDVRPPYSMMRWKPGTSLLGDVLDPLTEDHPHFATPCVCHKPLGNGTPVQLYVIGPLEGDDPSALENYNAGREFVTHALILHQPCATDLAEREEQRAIVRSLSDTDIEAEMVLRGVDVKFAPVVRRMAERTGVPVSEIAGGFGLVFGIAAELVQNKGLKVEESDGSED